MAEFIYKRDTVCGQSKNIEGGVGIIFRKDKNGFLKIAADYKPSEFSDSCIRTDTGYSADHTWSGSDSRVKKYAFRQIKDKSYTESDLLLDSEDFNDKLAESGMGIISGGSKLVGTVDHTDIDGAWKLITGLDRRSLAMNINEKFLTKSLEYFTGQLENDLESFSFKTRKLLGMSHVPKDNPSLGGQLHTESDPVFWGTSFHQFEMRKVTGCGEIPCIVIDPSDRPTRLTEDGGVEYPSLSDAGKGGRMWQRWLAPYGTRWEKTVTRTLSANGSAANEIWDKEVTTWKMLTDDESADSFIPAVDYHKYDSFNWRNAYMFKEYSRTKVKGTHPEHSMYEDGDPGDFKNPESWPYFKSLFWSYSALKSAVTKTLSIAKAAKRLYYFSIYEKKQATPALNVSWLSGHSAEADILRGYGYADENIINAIERYHTRHGTAHASRYRFQFHFAYIMFRWRFDSIFESLGLAQGAIDKRQQMFLDATNTQRGFNAVGWNQFTSFDASNAGNDTIICESFQMLDDDFDVCMEDWMRGMGAYLKDGLRFGEATEDDIDEMVNEQYKDIWEDLWPQATGTSMGNDDLEFNGWQRFDEKKIRQTTVEPSSDDDDDEDQGAGFDDDPADWCSDGAVECLTKRLFGWMGDCPKPYTDNWHTKSKKYRWPCGN